MTITEQQTINNQLIRAFIRFAFAALIVLMSAATSSVIAQVPDVPSQTADSRAREDQIVGLSPKDADTSTVVDSSSEALKKRLENTGEIPSADEPLNLIETRNSSKPTITPQSTTSQPRFVLTPYIWLASLKGDVGANGHVVHVDAGFKDVIDNVNFGFAMVFEVRVSDRVTLITDFNYLNLSEDRATPGPLFDGAEFTIKTYFVSEEVAFKVVEQGSSYFSLSAGARLFHQNMGLELRRGASRTNISKSATWIDPIVGFRLRSGNKFFVMLRGDIGGFGGASTFTWNVFGGAGVRIGKHGLLAVGYRYMDVDYRSPDFIYDTAMSGLMIGFGFRF